MSPLVKGTASSRTPAPHADNHLELQGSWQGEVRDRLSDMVRQYQPLMFVLVETHVMQNKAQRVTKKLGRQWNGIALDGSGAAGGIIIAWQGDNIQVLLAQKDEQAMHVIVSVNSFLLFYRAFMPAFCQFCEIICGMLCNLLILMSFLGYWGETLTACCIGQTNGGASRLGVQNQIGP